MNQLVWCRTFDSLSSCADTLLFQLSTRACNSSCAAPRCMLWYGVCCSSDVEAFKASSSTSPATSFCRDCAKAEWAVISIAAIDSERGMNARGRVGRLTDADAETALELRATCMNPTFFVPVIMCGALWPHWRALRLRGHSEAPLAGCLEVCGLQTEVVAETLVWNVATVGPTPDAKRQGGVSD